MRLSAISRKFEFETDSENEKSLAQDILREIEKFQQPVSFMEVCGTHTVAFFRTGIRRALPHNIRLVSGPGCPVCVTSHAEIEKAIRLASRRDVTMFCFGDMLKVPGYTNSLEEARGINGADVRIMYSPLDVVTFAEQNPGRKVVLFGVGFETTIPLFASVVLRARTAGIRNLFLLGSFKLLPPALTALLASDDLQLDGLILSGHVSAILGEDLYQPLLQSLHVRGVITGFEALDMLRGILALLRMTSDGVIGVRNEYTRVVSAEGNRRARGLIDEVFQPVDSVWRGLGNIPQSGLKLRPELTAFDAQQLIDFELSEKPDPVGCRCGDVIKGKCRPNECRLYKKVCTPHKPVGPCMVSSEGTCAAYYKYGE